MCILTVSDSRDLEHDRSGGAIEEALAGAGHQVVERGIVRDEPGAIRQAVLKAIARADVDAAIVTGGTGVSPRDSTPEAIEPLLERRLDGFGELFRSLSFQEIGAAAMLSRALAGTARRTAVFVLPGSVAAVRLGLERLILPELGHLIGQLRR
ncbi:MAG: molybdenum cofactor biosynthesis protein B [Myxococcota bacterium]